MVLPSPDITEYGIGSCTAEMAKINIAIDTDEFGEAILPNADAVENNVESLSAFAYPFFLYDECAVGDEFQTFGNISFFAKAGQEFTDAYGDCDILDGGGELYCYASVIWYIE